jgi:aspartate kinase
VIVLKFGGTSVGGAARILAVAERVEERRARQPAVVVSALAGVTDLLIRGARLSEAREDGADAIVQDLRGRHRAVTREAVPAGPAQEAVLGHVDAVLDELRALYAGVRNLAELTPRTLDAIAGMGERLSVEVVAAALRGRGLDAVAVDGRDVIVTDDAFGRATPLLEETGERVRASLRPLLARGAVPVVSGFVGRTRQGVASTLGRGGSDWSAAVIGAVLPAEEIQIWTDVDGMMTVDPRVVPLARVLPEVSFAEAAELAYFGAKVLHPATIKPAVERAIPVRILNSLNPTAPGTLIADHPGEPQAEGQPRAIAFKKGISVVLIAQPRMLMAYGFVARVFAVFDRHRTPVDLIATSEVSISLTVDDPSRLGAVEEELRPLGEVRTMPGMAIVSVVGRGFVRRPGLAGRVFQALREVNVTMISFGASDVNLSFVVAEEDAERAVRLLHREFFEAA